MNYYISDTHFWHKNILKFEKEKRPFETLEEMNREMIEKWNNKVTDDDVVYILGDISFGGAERTAEILESLNGDKVLILGNHDNPVLYKTVLKKYFKEITPYKEIKDSLSGEKKDIIMCHYPISVWNKKHYGSVHLFGHIHSNIGKFTPLKKIEENSFNVGVDVNNLEPCTLSEIVENNHLWRKEMEVRYNVCK